MNNIPLLLAILLMWLPRRLFVAGSLQQACFVTISLGFAFWYWLPALQLLNRPPIDVIYDVRLTPAAIAGTAWLILLYQLVTVIALALARPLIDDRPFEAGGQTSAPIVAIVTAASCIALFFARFAGEGAGVFRDILTGAVSARDLMSYYNRSEGARESLLALWEVLDVGACAYLAALYGLQARTLTWPNLLALAALVICFYGSGSRSYLLCGIEAIVVARVLRGFGDFDAALRATDRSPLRPLYAAALLLVTAGAVFGIGARFKFGAGNKSGFVLDTLVNNNDMFRESAFVFYNLADYRPTHALEAMIGFALTPFWYLFPSFLGFAKEIPEHLVYFNYQRAGIDLINGQGNVFPGIVGDFQLVFGLAGPLALALFFIGFCALLSAAKRRIPAESPATAFAVAMLAFLFISMRNIQGSLALLYIGGLALAFAIAWRANDDNATDRCD